MSLVNCRKRLGPGLSLTLGFLVMAAMVVSLCTTQAEGAGLSLRDQEVSQTLKLKVGQSKVLRTPFAITRVSVADPEVADIILTSAREIYINGLAPGVTNLSLWGGNRFTSARVTVEADVSLLKEKLAEILPKEKISVKTADESIVLAGEVAGPGAQETAIALALPFAGGKKDRIINLMHVGGVQQVLLEVRVAEIDRAVGRQLGVNFSITGPGNALGVSTVGGLTTVQNIVATITQGTTTTTSTTPQLVQAVGPLVNGIAQFTTGQYLWTLFFQLLKQNNLGRLLAEPNLVTTSGQEASFLAGGEFPVPVPQQFQTITIQYKKFGVGLVFTPTVLDEGRIAMRLNPEVSELDFSIGVTLTIGGQPVPGLRVRRLSSHIEVNDGQTFAIAGLIADSHRGAVSRYPVLGDIPVLGALFRSTSYQKSESELVVLVTPHLVKPVTATAAKLPTDKYIEPNDVELYLLGNLQGKDQAKARAAAPAAPAPEAAPAAAPAAGSLPSDFGRQPVK